MGYSVNNVSFPGTGRLVGRVSRPLEEDLTSPSVSRRHSSPHCKRGRTGARETLHGPCVVPLGFHYLSSGKTYRTEVFTGVSVVSCLPFELYPPSRLLRLGPIFDSLGLSSRSGTIVVSVHP